MRQSREAERTRGALPGLSLEPKNGALCLFGYFCARPSPFPAFASHSLVVCFGTIRDGDRERLPAIRPMASEERLIFCEKGSLTLWAEEGRA